MSETPQVDMSNWETYENEDLGVNFKYPQEFVKEIADNSGRIRITTSGTDEISKELYDIQILEIIPAKDLNNEYLTMNQREPQAENELRDILFNKSRISPIYSTVGDGSAGGFSSIKMYTYQLSPEYYAKINNFSSGSGTFCADGGLGHTIESCKRDPQCVVMESCDGFVSEQWSRRSTTPEQLETALQIIETIKLSR